jgi:hypothetical protein
MVRLDLVREKLRVMRTTLDALRARLPDDPAPLGADRYAAVVLAWAEKQAALGR